MAGAAHSFLENNKPITHCPKCKLKLVNEEYIHNFDKKGNYITPTKVVDACYDYTQIFNNNCNLAKTFYEVINCLAPDHLVVEGIVENQKKSKEEYEAQKGIKDDFNLHNYILIKAICGKKEHIIYNINLATINYANIGGRYNSFYVDLFAKQNALYIDFLQRVLTQDLRVKVKTKQKVDFEKELLTYKV